MKSILKKAELVNTIADSVTVITLTEEKVINTSIFVRETRLFNCKGKLISEHKKNYEKYSDATQSYSNLLSMLA